MKRLAITSLATIVLGVCALTPGIIEASCHPVFVAGEGVIDSCTGQHRSPYPDPPPQPTVIYVDVTVSPEINVNVVNVANANATSSSGSSAGVSSYVVKPVVKKPKP